MAKLVKHAESATAQCGAIVTDFGALVTTARQEGWSSGAGELDTLRRQVAVLGWRDDPAPKQKYGND
jgi:hypothetical protein